MPYSSMFWHAGISCKAPVLPLQHVFSAAEWLQNHQECWNISSLTRCNKWDKNEREVWISKKQISYVNCVSVIMQKARLHFPHIRISSIFHRLTNFGGFVDSGLQVIRSTQDLFRQTSILSISSWESLDSPSPVSWCSEASFRAIWLCIYTRQRKDWYFHSGCLPQKISGHVRQLFRKLCKYLIPLERSKSYTQRCL